MGCGPPAPGKGLGGPGLRVGIQAGGPPLPLGEGLGVRGERSGQKTRPVQDCQPDGLQILQDVVVQKPKHPNAQPLKLRRAPLVFNLAPFVTLPVHFHDKLRRLAPEIHNVTADDLLSSELQSSNLPVSEQVPQDPLGHGGIAAQFSCPCFEILR